MHCLELRGEPTFDSDSGTDDCEQADYNACRQHSDCMPVFWQKLGEGDGPVGDPYYQRCVAEGEARP
jgi:hypothetical protein